MKPIFAFLTILTLALTGCDAADSGPGTKADSGPGPFGDCESSAGIVVDAQTGDWWLKQDPCSTGRCQPISNWGDPDGTIHVKGICCDGCLDGLDRCMAVGDFCSSEGGKCLQREHTAPDGTKVTFPECPHS